MPPTPGSTPGSLVSSLPVEIEERARAALDQRLWPLFVSYYNDFRSQYGDRPQYRLLIEGTALLATKLWEIFPRITLNSTKTELDHFAKINSLLRNNIDQLQRHTESMKIDVRQWDIERYKYVQAVEMATDEFVKDPATRAAFHERIAELIIGPNSGYASSSGEEE